MLLAVPDPYPNHNGGMLAFGPDGYLYVGTGDGGDGGDPQNRAQSLGQWFGKILRLDVADDADGIDNDGLPYTIPADNPFVGRAGAIPEIWALGLRNPWRYSFDRQTGDLWIGDVGQALIDEIDRLPAGSAGGANFQWRCVEGDQPYAPDPPCTEGRQTPSIFVYNHTQGRCSITGGYVYRGSLAPSLSGVYLFGDYCGGQVYALLQNGGTWAATMLLDSTYSISSFGQDQSGEVYLVDITGGAIYRFVDGAAATVTSTATGIPASTATRTPTPTTTRTATPSATPSVTPTLPAATATATATSTPTATLPAATATAAPSPSAPVGTQTVTFDDRAGQNQPLNGPYPAGVIDWDGVGATLTLACAGQPTATATLAAGQVATVATGWSGTCTTVTMTSTNGWHTNVDDLVLDGG